MKSLVCLIIFSMVVAVCVGVSWPHKMIFEDDMLEDDALTVAEDLYEYLTMQEMEYNADALEVEKRGRGRKVGPCRSPSGKMCELCNFKIRNKQNMNRYILCTGGTSKDRKVRI